MSSTMQNILMLVAAVVGLRTFVRSFGSPRSLFDWIMTAIVLALIAIYVMAFLKGVGAL